MEEADFDAGERYLLTLVNWLYKSSKIKIYLELAEEKRSLFDFEQTILQQI